MDLAMDHFVLELPDNAANVRVTSARGEEAMSSLFRFDVSILAGPDEGFPRRVIDTAATFTMHFDGAPVRAIHGIVGGCRAVGRDRSDMTNFELRIVPRMARLKKRRTSRIFQDMTTREIVEQVLAVSKIPNRWLLARSLPTRAYCVQYDETDYAFVTRLCAADGIFFSFDHPLADSTPGQPTNEIICFSDTAEGYGSMGGRADLRFRPPGGDGGALATEEDQVQHFQLRHVMRSKRVLFRRFDFQKPPIPLRDAASLDDTKAPAEHNESMRGCVDDGATIYEHQHTREEALLDPLPAQTALEAENADATLAEGETAGRRLVPGWRFRLLDHILPETDGEYAVTSCKLECHSPLWAQAGQPIYRNQFTAVPASVPFRPARPRRRVRQSLETATVVGPVGEEIYTDELGRVKVQFHWDLQGRFNDKSSCWLRVLQPWAGAGYGTQFLPRVGHEVLVGYIDGDSDRPVVLGSLHNGVNATPFSFPRDNTRSGIKTWTSPQGQGGHELMFEDRAGSELVALRSNRTMQISAAEDSTLSAERDLRISTGGDRDDEVLGDAAARVAGNEVRTTEGHQHVQIGGSELREVAGSRDVVIGGDDRQQVKGASVQVIHGSRVTVIGDTRAAAHDQLGVAGQYTVASVQEMSLSSERQVQIACGKSKITLRPDRILIEAPEIQLQAKDRIALVQGDPPQATLTLAGSAALGGGTVSVAAGGKDGDAGKLYLDADAHLDGALVKLNCGPMGGAGGKVVREQEEKGPVTFTVLREGIPPEVSTVTLVVATPTGEVVERQCAVGGSVSFEGKKGEVFTVVETRIGEKAVSVQKKAEVGEE